MGEPDLEKLGRTAERHEKAADRDLEPFDLLELPGQALQSARGGGVPPLQSGVGQDKFTFRKQQVIGVRRRRGEGRYRLP